MAKSEWHHPRTDFAKQVYTLLAESPATAVSLLPDRFRQSVVRSDPQAYLQERIQRISHQLLQTGLQKPDSCNPRTRTLCTLPGQRIHSSCRRSRTDRSAICQHRRCMGCDTPFPESQIVGEQLPQMARTACSSHHQ